MTHHDPDDPIVPDDQTLAELIAGLDDADFERSDPPVDLFDRIRSQVASPRTDEGVPPEHRPTVATSGVPVVVRFGESRRARRLRYLAAAVTVLVIGTIGVVLAARDDTPVDRQLASTTLEQLEPLGSTSATARLVDENGTTHLIVDATNMAPPPPGSSYELWLIDREASDPRSLGTITGSGDIVVPTTIDPGEHPVVDISLEPNDGDSAHSGHSLMRGTLT